MAASAVIGILVMGAWLRPWQPLRSNPSLHGVITGRANAVLVGGCKPTDERNLISCVQYVDFDAASTHVRYGRVVVTDGARRAEDPATIPVTYERDHPQHFQLAEGNPGLGTRVLGTAWLTFMTAAGGLLGTFICACIAATIEARRNRGLEAEPATHETDHDASAR